MIDFGFLAEIPDGTVDKKSFRTNLPAEVTQALKELNVLSLSRSGNKFSLKLAKATSLPMGEDGTMTSATVSLGTEVSFVLASASPTLKVTGYKGISIKAALLPMSMTLAESERTDNGDDTFTYRVVLQKSIVKKSITVVMDRDDRVLRFAL
jgi:hypothetical protein